MVLKRVVGGEGAVGTGREAGAVCGTAATVDVDVTGGGVIVAGNRDSNATAGSALYAVAGCYTEEVAGGGLENFGRGSVLVRASRNFRLRPDRLGRGSRKNAQQNRNRRR